MLAYGALEKALEAVNPKQPKRNGNVRTNKNLRESSGLGKQCALAEHGKQGFGDWRRWDCRRPIGGGEPVHGHFLSRMESDWLEGSQP